MQEITIQTPDDWHLHLRDGEFLAETVPATARCFGRAIVMPNLVPPITSSAMAIEYQERIQASLPKGHPFIPLMTLYLNDHTTVEHIIDAKKAGIMAAKLYPAGATTHSDSAVSSLESLYPVFEAMATQGMLLLIHGEVTEPEVDIFDREKIFIDRYLAPLSKRFTELKIVFEHITTSEAVQFVNQAPTNIAATITPQHLMLNRNDLLLGGIRPHNFCLPVLKRNTHQLALQDAARKGSNKFFLGTDSAPHTKLNKESSCGCAGCYSAPAAIEMYTQIFEELGALEKLEGFASHHGPDFYGLERNKSTITLERIDWKVPSKVKLSSGETIVPFQAGSNLKWKLKLPAMA